MKEKLCSFNILSINCNIKQYDSTQYDSTV